MSYSRKVSARDLTWNEAEMWMRMRGLPDLLDSIVGSARNYTSCVSRTKLALAALKRDDLPGGISVFLDGFTYAAQGAWGVRVRVELSQHSMFSAKTNGDSWCEDYTGSFRTLLWSTSRAAKP